MKSPRWMSSAAVVAAFGCAVAACGPTAPDPTTSGPVPKTAPTTISPRRATAAPRRHEASGRKPRGTSSPYTWSRSTSAGLRLGGGATSTLSTVLAPPDPGDDWLLAGTRMAAGGDTTATVWTSADAITWTSAALRGGGPHGQARGAAIWGNRTVVVGSIGTGAAQRAAVWISSAPGAPFSAVADSPALDVPAGATSDFSAGSKEPAGNAGALVTSSGQGAVMDTVTSGALGLFAAGSVAGQLALWYSSNGTSWQRLSKAESVIRSSPGATVRQILETPSGVFAVGSLRDGTSTDAALWTSTDSINWRKVPAPSSFTGPGDQVLTGLATFGNNLVVAGGIRLASSWIPASWISPNSFTWGPPSESFPEPTGLRADIGGTVVSDLAVSPDGTTLAAVGGSRSEQRLWISTDGINWTPQAFPAAAARDADWTAGAVATAGGTTVVIDPEPGQPRMLVDTPTAWHEVSANPATFGSPEPVATPTKLLDDGHRLVLAVSLEQPGQALGQSQRSTVILTSRDGVHWAPASTGHTFTGQTVTGLATTPSGLLAVGWPSGTGATVGSAPTGSPAATGMNVWASADGSRWTVESLRPTGITAPTPTTTTSAPPTATTGNPTTPKATTPNATTPNATTTNATTTNATTTNATASADTAPADTSAGRAPRITAADTRTGAVSTQTNNSPARAPTTVTTTASIPTTVPTAPTILGRRPPASATEPSGSGTAVASGRQLFVAGAAPGNPAMGWTSSNGSTWTATGTLDQAPPAAPETVAGACPTPSGPVAVGSVQAGPGGGSQAMVWALTGHAAPTVSPEAAAGSEERLFGCATLDGRLVAWGVSTANNGSSQASLWSSTKGTTWSRQDISAFSSAQGTAGITDLAGDGSTWLAVTGASTTPWTGDTLGALGVWASTDEGKAWAQLPTTGPAWTSSYGVSADQVAYLGARPVIAGDVDGQLAVWTGTPSASSSARA